MIIFYNPLFRKKLRDIEALEAKLASGEISTPEPEQLEKVKKLHFVQLSNWRRSKTYILYSWRRSEIADIHTLYSLEILT